MRPILRLFAFLTVFSSNLFAQNHILEKYVSTGLSQNLAIKQKRLSLQQSLQALKEARGLFLPRLDVEARYTRAGGGREIVFPVGDLINPIYGTLNELLQAQGSPARFPENLENERIPFLREKEQETRLRLVQPVFQPQLVQNYRIKRNLKRMQYEETAVFARQLAADIKTAWFQYLITIKITTLLEKTQPLLTENVRVSEALVKNEKATRDILYRAKAELSEFEQQFDEAQKNVSLAARYFNFLLNTDFDAEIVQVDAPQTAPAISDVTALTEAALEHREELEQLRHAVNLKKNQIKLARAGYLPNVTVVLDYGIQGESYAVGKEDDFWSASAVMRWNLFNGFQDKAKVSQARIDRENVRTQLEELKRRIELQVREQYDNMLVAQKTISSASARLASAKQSFELVRKKYEQGLAPQIEFLDARKTMTDAEINAIIAKYNLQIQHARLERVAALYDLSGVLE